MVYLLCPNYLWKFPHLRLGSLFSIIPDSIDRPAIPTPLSPWSRCALPSLDSAAPYFQPPRALVLHLSRYTFYFRICLIPHELHSLCLHPCGIVSTAGARSVFVGSPGRNGALKFKAGETYMLNSANPHQVPAMSQQGPCYYSREKNAVFNYRGDK